MFEVVFDYGDHDEHAPQPEPTRAWPCRPDPFSTYRPGFEVRTYRRCHRVLMFHHFPGEPGVGASCLVRSTDLAYREHRRQRHDHGGVGDAHRIPAPARRVPRPSRCRRWSSRYSQAVIGHEPRDLGPEALQNLPAGIDGAAYQWVDLDGEGLSGILARQGGAWFYKANLGDGRFAPERMLTAQPAMAGAGGQGHQQLLDLAGDGHLDLAELGGPMPGFYERTRERELAAVPPVPVPAEHLVGRPRPAHGRPGRGRPGRRADHRRRRVHLVPVARLRGLRAAPGGPTSRGARSRAPG